MSATRDKTQKFTFVYNNLYSIYKNTQDQNAVADRPGLTTGQVIKADDLKARSVEEFKPVQFLHRPVARKNEALESLKQNLQTLNNLHARLKFMLKEIEDLSKS